MDFVTVLTAVFLLLFTLLVFIYRFLSRKNDYFRSKPIPSLPGPLFFGGTKPMMLSKESFPEYVKRVYDKFHDAKVFGVMNTILPLYVLRDPELIKKIAIKDFDHFTDHRPIFGSDHGDHPNLIACKALFVLTGQKWKTMRATLSPAFTGSKMKLMFELIVECSEALVAYYREQGDDVAKEWDMKDVFARFANDVIATCAFGIKVNSSSDRDNEFYRKGKEMMVFTNLKTRLKILGYSFAPKLMNWFGIDLISQEHSDYFSGLIRDTVRTREANGIVRPDMVHLLMQSRKGMLTNQQEDNKQQEDSETARSQPETIMTESEMIGQCLFFFLAGFDTVSTSMTFLAYELALNPDIQEKLYEEIAVTNQSLNKRTITFEVLQTIKYLDMVISETLRLWPSAPAVDRLCVQDYTLDDDQGLRCHMEKGTGVWIPIYGIHRDPKHFPEPDKFEPERFSEQRKGDIQSGTYMPFGIGPRSCIGMRFALMELKCIVYYLLLNFRLERTENTMVPPVLEKGFVTLSAANGLKLKMVPR
ncbi:probable cytochrome P450 9f2 [Aedes albopictus]|uniref:Cytochrome P450 n=1 Tax=Aedes albopictus TaxID=7160 RepID=A0ABM1ZYZ8_AEDAL